MPQKFKALATITGWVLFIFGFFSLAITFVFMMINQGQAGFGEPPAIQASINIAIGVVSMALSVVIMKLRQMLE